ncbi:MAG: GNAT family N-acetyltransferase [Rufibacter sp.]
MHDVPIRVATGQDVAQILRLYQLVSQQVGGLARVEEEITETYVANFSLKASQTGIHLVVEDRQTGTLVGEIHCYQLEPRVFSHVLSELTVAVHPDYQGQGVGKRLFQTLLQQVEIERSDILRVELIARESNQKAIALYQKLGFQVEGRLVNRIKSSTGGFEADIPMAWVRGR